MTAFIDRIQPAPRGGGYSEDDHWIWCGSVIRGEDGRYHMFASRWSKDVPFAPNWLTNSEVVRASSDTPIGPFRFEEVVLPPRGEGYWDGKMTHNPTIHRCGDTYLLYYTGTSYEGPVPRQPGEVDAERRLEARANQRIGLATAKSVFGPWTRPDAPILEVRPDHWDALITTNPAPCVREDGSVLLLYKSTREDKAAIQYGVAAADHYTGLYQRLSDHPLAIGEPGVSYEDAYLWYGQGRYQMIFNDLQGHFTGEHHAGGHAVSDDGVQWEMAAPNKAYSRKVRWDDGEVEELGNFERPQLLIEGGQPTHLYAGAANGHGWHQDATHTWNMVIPLA